MNESLIKLEPTNLYLNINTNKVDNIDRYKYLGTYCEYELDFDVKPFIKDSIIKQVKVLDRLPENCTHFMIILIVNILICLTKDTLYNLFRNKSNWVWWRYNYKLYTK
jgi:hypothetical protein